MQGKPYEIKIIEALLNGVTPNGKIPRTEALIVPQVFYQNNEGEFCNQHWAYDVGYCFRDALDIQYTDIALKNYHDHMKHPSTPIKKLPKTTIQTRPKVSLLGTIMILTKQSKTTEWSASLPHTVLIALRQRGYSNMRHDNKGASFNANITTKSDDKDSDPKTIQETRKLAVGKFTSQYQSKQDPHLFEPRQLPFIRLKGEWLESLGFQVGDILTLEGSHQRIVLTGDEQQSGPAKRNKPSGGESL